jgi:hypothetical protein
MKFALAIVMLCLPGLRPAAAQDVAVFGAQLCRTYLSDPDPAHIGISWVMGFWSGLNGGSLLRRDKTDTGHTLQAADVNALVIAVCRQKPDMLLSLAATTAWLQAKADHR